MSETHLLLNSANAQTRHTAGILTAIYNINGCYSLRCVGHKGSGIVNVGSLTPRPDDSVLLSRYTSVRTQP